MVNRAEKCHHVQADDSHSERVSSALIMSNKHSQEERQSACPSTGNFAYHCAGLTSIVNCTSS